MAAVLDHVLCAQLAEAVEHLTTSGQPSLDKGKLKEIKNICRTSDAFVGQLFHLVMTQLRMDHAEIRLSAFQIIQEIFARSHHFRELLVSDFQEFLELTSEMCLEMPLPPPKAAANLLKEQTLKTVQNWYEKFGQSYKKLALGYNYLKHVKRVDFNNIQAATLAEQQREAARKKKMEIALQEKMNVTVNEIHDTLPDMQRSLTELENCLQLLLPSPDTFDHNEDTVDERCSSQASSNTDNLPSSQNSATSEGGVESGSCESSQEQGDSFLQDHGLTSWNYNISIELNQDSINIEEDDNNTDIITTIDDVQRLLSKTCIPKIVKWMEVLSKSGKEEDKIKKCIDMKQKIQASLDKVQKLNVKRRLRKVPSPVDDDEDDDDEFEDVPEKEGYEPHIPDHLRKEYGLEPLPPEDQASTSVSKWSITQNKKDDLIDPTSRAAALESVKKRLAALQKSKSVNPPPGNTVEGFSGSKTKSDVNSRREKELAIAPTVPYDMDLYHWDHLDNMEAPSIQRPDAEHRFWKPVDNEDVIVIEKKKESLKWRSINFSGTFEPVKWSCRTPLPNGKLCERRDRFKCPFHGKIIARDGDGRPSDPECKEQPERSTNKSSKGFFDQDLQRDIEAAIGLDMGSSQEVTGKAGKGKRKGKGKGKKAKYPNLTSIKKQSTAQTRLEKKVFNPSSMKRIAKAMTNLEQRRHNDKFANQFNYAIN
ncbi:UV-stimulated scaffold protein A-like [Anneissia japonica]|uniref:UV-stimulated scaffold protein A-like n=1 Tax=Anneissia japonica TaxID=1529436 RepID=UPI0014259C72|nr:UV-stimulated scaffold protein A-like [Anneissia japonica]